MSAQQIETAIAQGCDALGQQLDNSSIGRLAELLCELERWNRRFNLTAIREPSEMVAAHVLDSLAVRPFLRGRTVIDIGTGAGFPGLPLAIAEPQRQFTLLDSNGKKIRFVQHMIGQLGLESAVAVQARAEDYEPGRSFDTVIARALASVKKIIELGGHLAAANGVVLALKGQYPAAELEQLDLDDWEHRVDRIEVPGLAGHSRHIVSLERRAE